MRRFIENEIENAKALIELEKIWEMKKGKKDIGEELKLKMKCY